MFKVFKKYVLFKTTRNKWGDEGVGEITIYEIGKQNLHVRKFRLLKKELKKTTLNIQVIHGDEETPDAWNTRTIKKTDVVATAETVELLKSQNSMYFI